MLVDIFIWYCLADSRIGLEKRDAAVGFHPWNRFGQTATYCSFEDMKFENCARKIYFGEAGQDDSIYAFGTRTPGWNHSEH